MSNNDSTKSGADFSYFELFDPDEFETPPVCMLPKRVEKTLEDYPEIVQGIIQMWGKQDYFLEFLKLKGLSPSTLNRANFPQSVIDEVNLLIKIHYEVYGKKTNQGPVIVKTTLEDFPHLMRDIQLYWGNPNDFHEYLELKNLHVQERDRGGFPIGVIEEIDLLTQIHDTVYGLPKPKVKNDFQIHKDNWNINNKVR